MDENGATMLTGIWQIVRLKEIVKKWQSVTRGSRASPVGSPRSHGVISPVIHQRLTDVIVDSDEESGQSPEPPPDVPKGYFAVYVGKEPRRFIVPTSYLSHSVFKVLLEKTEEEYGFDHSGALKISCDAEIFKYLLKCMETQEAHHSCGSSDGHSSFIEE